jgi:hypothetical protein
LALSLLAISGVLAAILQHDGAFADDPAILASSAMGDSIEVKAALEPFTTPPESRLGPTLDDMLLNFTYVLVDPSLEEAGVLVLVTDEEPHVATDSVVVEGEVLHTGLHPDHSGRTLVLIRATDWTHPILVR